MQNTARALSQLLTLRTTLRERVRCPIASALLALMDGNERLLLSDLTVDYIRDQEDSGLSELDLLWSWFVVPPRSLDLDRVDTARALILAQPDANAVVPSLTLQDRALLALVLKRPSPPPLPPPSSSIPYAVALLKGLEPSSFDPHRSLPLNVLPQVHAEFGKHSETTFRFLELVARAAGSQAFCRMLQVGEPSLPPVATPPLVSKVREVLERDLKNRRNFEIVLRNAVFGSLCRWGALALRERRGVRVFNASDPLRDSFVVPLGDALEKKDEFLGLVEKVLSWRSQQSTEAWPDAWRQVALMECFCEWLSERVVDPLREVEDKGVGKTGIVAIETFFSRNSYLRWYEMGTEKAKAKAVRSVLHGRPALPQIWHLGDRRWWVRVGGAPEGVRIFARVKGESDLSGIEGEGARGWVKCEGAVEAIAEWYARAGMETFEFGAPIPALG